MAKREENDLIDEALPQPLCSLCKEPLRADAKKCAACGGFQGKWFFLNLSLPILGLLVALVSVISLSATLLSPLLKPQASDVRVSFQYFQDGAAHFVASNIGNRPGMIGESWFDYVENKKAERYYLVEKAGNRYIPPASSRELTFTIPCEPDGRQVEYQRSEGLGNHQISVTEIVISTIQFDGLIEFKKFPIDSLQAAMAVGDGQHDCIQSKLLSVATAPSRAKVNGRR